MDRDRLEVVLTTLQANREECLLESPGLARARGETEQSITETPVMRRKK